MTENKNESNVFAPKVTDVKAILKKSGIAQTDAVAAFHVGAKNLFTDLSVAIDRADRDRTLAVALDTHLAERTGRLVPKGESVPKTAEGMLNGKEWASVYSVGGSMVTTWRTLGHALVVAGVNPTERETKENPVNVWRMLAFKGCATLADVTAEVYREGSDAASIMAACRKFRHADGSAIPKSERAGETPTDGRPNAGTTPETGDAGAPEVVPTDIPALLKALDVALKAIPETDTETWPVVETALNRMITRENTLRIKRAKATPAKVAAAKKTAAVKAA